MKPEPLFINLYFQIFIILYVCWCDSLSLQTLWKMLKPSCFIKLLLFKIVIGGGASGSCGYYYILVLIFYYIALLLIDLTEAF